MRRVVLLLLVTGIIISLFTPLARAKTIKLKMVNLKDNTHQYYHELLQKSLAAVGHKLIIKEVPDLPQKRISRRLDRGKISIHWYLNSTAHNQRWTPVKVGLTNQLIGQRILFITPGTQSAYNQVDNLKEFRQLDKVAGFGQGWFDAEVWAANNLNHHEQAGDWRNLYRMVAAGNRGVDYFPRGLTEILLEAKHYPQLEIEDNLVLVYERDFRFYLSEAAAHHKETIKEALQQAKESGLLNRLIKKYWADTKQQLNYKQRTKIQLKTPQK